MKFLYVAALLVPTILAADMGVRDTLLADAQSVENAGGLAGLLQLVKKEV